MKKQIDHQDTSAPSPSGRAGVGIKICGMKYPENMLEVGGAVAADPQLTKGCIPKCMPESCEALVEDLLAMGDEKQARPRQAATQPLIIQRGHDRLAGACGGYE